MTTVLGFLRYHTCKLGIRAMRLRAANTPSVSAATLRRATFHGNYHVRVSAAKNPNQSPDMIAEIILSLPIDLRYAKREAKVGADSYNEGVAQASVDYLEQSYTGWHTVISGRRFRFTTVADCLEGCLQIEQTWHDSSNRLNIAREIIRSHNQGKRRAVVEILRAANPNLAEKLQSSV